jgi:membrane-associated protease RseP (regulator of RpoE activity)
MTRLIKVLIGSLFVLILAVGVFGILPQLGFTNPLASLFEGTSTSLQNAALDASGLKEKAANALKNNREKIASATGLSTSQVDEAIRQLDIENWTITSLPDDAVSTGTVDVTYSGTNATVTTYTDPSIVTVKAYGQNVTLEVPENAQPYLPYLSYLE